MAGSTAAKTHATVSLSSTLQPQLHSAPPEAHGIGSEKCINVSLPVSSIPNWNNASGVLTDVVSVSIPNATMAGQLVDGKITTDGSNASCQEALLQLALEAEVDACQASHPPGHGWRHIPTRVVGTRLPHVQQEQQRTLPKQHRTSSCGYHALLTPEPGNTKHLYAVQVRLPFAADTKAVQTASQRPQAKQHAASNSPSIPMHGPEDSHQVGTTDNTTSISPPPLDAMLLGYLPGPVAAALEPLLSAGVVEVQVNHACVALTSACLAGTCSEQSQA